MAVDPTLETLLTELMTEFDETIDTSAGSAFDTQVMSPFLERIGGSPLEGDLETFLVSRVDTEIENADTSPFSGIRDLVIRAMIPVLEPMRREIRAVKVAQSLNNFQQMTREEVDSLLGNYFTALNVGGKARVTATLFFPSPQSVIFTPIVQFSTGGGLNFFPVATQSISNTQMSFNQLGDLFFVDVLLESEGAGEDYNIAPNDIVAVVGIAGALRVTNQAAADVRAFDEESKAEGIARTQNSITIRNLITDRGVKFVIPENFPSVEVLQVIGFGDLEMDRDVINGVADISEIPGGIAGNENPALSGVGIHIGGKTDVYVYQETPDPDDVDIQNVTDKGIRIFAGIHGFTFAGSPTGVFNDEFGIFTQRGIDAGDLLYLGEDIYEIASFDETTLDVIQFGTGPTAIAAGLFGQTYEIVRRETGFIDVPLYDLIAEEDGVPVFDTDGDPVAPVPGALAKTPLRDGGGVYVKKQSLAIQSVAAENMSLPLLRVEDVEFLDSLTLETTGIFVPMSDVLLVTAAEDFERPVGGPLNALSVGFARLWFRDAVNMWVSNDLNTQFNLFPVETDLTFLPLDEATGTGIAGGALLGQIITITGVNLTATGTNEVAAGYRILLSGTHSALYTVIGGVFTGGNTELSIREELPVTFSLADYSLHVGVLEADMLQDTASGLYYFDVEIHSVLPSVTIPLEGAEFQESKVRSEGWTVKTTKAVLSYSTKELPYIRFTDWVNDTTELGDIATNRTVRLAYKFASSIRDIQTFSEDPDNRIVAEDVLIRHFLTAYVRADITQRGLEVDAAKATTVAYINNLDPTDPLEVSDVNDALYDTGANYVRMPLTLVGLFQDSARGWSLLSDQDTLGSNRIQHFIADEDFIDLAVG